jgi:hypothetical protein
VKCQQVILPGELLACSKYSDKVVADTVYLSHNFVPSTCLVLGCVHLKSPFVLAAILGQWWYPFLRSETAYRDQDFVILFSHYIRMLLFEFLPIVLRIPDIQGSIFNSETNYEGVSKSFRTGRLERELQMVQVSATRCSCIAILWVSLMSLAAITLCDMSDLYSRAATVLANFSYSCVPGKCWNSVCKCTVPISHNVAYQPFMIKSQSYFTLYSLRSWSIVVK